MKRLYNYVYLQIIENVLIKNVETQNFASLHVIFVF